MHIVYISREYPPALRMGGIASYVREIAETMVGRGHKVTVIAASDDTSQKYSECINGVRIIRLSGGDFVLSQKESTAYGLRKMRVIYRFNAYRKAIARVLDKLEGVDIIEVGEYGAEGYYLHDCGVPITLRLHTPTFLDRSTGGVKPWKAAQFHEHWVGHKEFKDMKRYRFATSCSRSLAEWTRQNVEGFTDNIDVIYNPLNLSNWEWLENQKYQENTVLFAGTVAESKGVGNLIDAVALVQHSKRVKLRIAGKLGEYGLRLQAKCHAKDYDWCEFLGHVDREKLQSLYRQSKVSCFPSWWENMPMVCIEAMAIGNVVIGSANGGMSEIITDSVDGYLVQPQNTEDLKRVLSIALNLDIERIGQMRRNAYATIEQNFSGAIIASQLENHYLKVIKAYEKSVVD